MKGEPHLPAPSRDCRSLAKYAWLSVLAALATIALKTAAWWVTDSVGLLSDAAESLVNLIAAGVTVYAVKVSARPPDTSYNFGHSKAEYLSAALEGQLIAIAALTILVQSVLRWLDPQPVQEVTWGVATSCLAAAINGAVAWLLLRVGRTHDSSALVADGKHLLTDLWTTAGVVLGVIAVQLTGILWLDPLVAFAVGLHILWVGWELTSSASQNLRDRAWEPEALAELYKLLAGVSGPEIQVDRVRTRISGPTRFVDLKLAVPPEWTIETSQKKTKALKRSVLERFPRTDVICQLTSLEPCLGSNRTAPSQPSGQSQKPGEKPSWPVRDHDRTASFFLFAIVVLTTRIFVLFRRPG